MSVVEPLLFKITFVKYHILGLSIMSFRHKLENFLRKQILRENQTKPKSTLFLNHQVLCSRKNVVYLLNQF